MQDAIFRECQRKIKRLLITGFFLPLFLVFPLTLHADVVLHTELDKTQVAVGDTLDVTVRMEWEQSEGSDIFVVKVDPPSSKSLEITRSKESTSSKLTSKGPVGTRTLQYTFKAKESGETTIDPVVVEYISSPDQKDPTMKRGEPIPIKIVSRTKGFMAKAVVLSVALLGISIVLGIPFVLWKRGVFKRRGGRISSDSGYRLEKERLAKLKEIRTYHVTGGIHLMYGEVENLLAEYIENKYQVPVRGKPESEVRSLAKAKSIPDELVQLYVNILHAAEQVRFGGLYPTKDEQEKFLRDVEIYFKSLIPKVSEEETIETID